MKSETLIDTVNRILGVSKESINTTIAGKQKQTVYM